MLSTDILKARTKRRLNFSLRLLIAPLGIILTTAVLIFFHQRFLIVKEITCRMGDPPCPEGVVSVLNRLNGKSLLRLNQKGLQKQILATGLVDRIEFITKLPGKLIVVAQPPAVSFLVKTAFSKTNPSLSFLISSTSAAPSTELANYVASMEGKTFQLLSTGALNQSDSDSNYFLISQSIPVKDYLSKVFIWLHSLALSSMKPDTIYFLSDMIILKQKDQPDLIMSISSNPEDIILALQRLNEAITIKKPTVIDFRYSHPILK